MELIKKNIHMLRRKSEAVNQVTFDEDMNVPDIKPDIGRMIQKKGEVSIDEVTALDGQANIKGNLKFYLLYVSEGDEKKTESLQGEIPIDEVIYLQGVDSGDKICLKWEIEDLSIYMINSRKINVKALIAFKACVDQLLQIQIPVDVKEENVSIQRKTLRALNLGVHKKDIVRLKKEISLSSTKPNIYEVLWNDVEVRGLDIRSDTDRIVVKGELCVFILYSADDSDHPLQWVEQAVPFQQEAKCSGCTLDMISDVEAVLLQTHVEVKPDLDGEERILQVEAVMELEMKIYQEIQYPLVCDLYTPKIQYLPERKEVILESLLVKNYSKCKVSERVALHEMQGDLLQICHSEGSIKLDEMKVMEHGILAEGIIQVRILYIAGDDDMPFYAMETMIPFSHVIEAREIDQNCKYYVKTDLEQLSTTMADNREIEVKAVLNLNALVFQCQEESLLIKVEEKEIDKARLGRMPGIICYRVQDNDTLWEIAKTFYTTVDEIKNLNQLESEELVTGEALILVKRVEE